MPDCPAAPTAARRFLRLALGAGLAAALAAPAARAVAPGELAPDFQLPATLNPADPWAGSAPVTLSALRGRPLYLDFWASWCGPCKQSFPWMNTLAQRFAAQGLQVLAINLDTQPEAARQFLAQVPAHFRIAWDAAGDTPRRYAIKGMPTAVLIGADGRVRLVHAGFRPEDRAALEAAIEQALQAGAGP